MGARGAKAKKLYLYDPRTNITKETTFEYLEGLTGKPKLTLMSYRSKRKKVGNINCYLVDDTLTVKQRKEWYTAEKYHNEVWKKVEGLDGKYLISNYGRFKRVCKSGKEYFLLPFLKKSSGRRDYLLIKLSFNKVGTSYDIAKLVAKHFNPGPKPGEVLHHKNLVKTDNFSGNLEYISREKLGRKTSGLNNRSKPVVQFDKDTMEVMGEFKSAREAGRQCFVSYQAVMDNCNKKTKVCGGAYVFMWEEEYEDLIEGIG
jgi:hypothetical protein